MTRDSLIMALSLPSPYPLPPLSLPQTREKYWISILLFDSGESKLIAAYIESIYYGVQ